MVFLATLGLWDVFFGFEENKCSMSYMFEYPEYQVRPSLTCAPTPPGLLSGSDGTLRLGALLALEVSCFVLGRASSPPRPLVPHPDSGPRLLTAREPALVPLPNPYTSRTLLCLQGDDFSSRPVMGVRQISLFWKEAASCRVAKADLKKRL